MISREKKAIVILDMVLLIMTASWILFGVAKGISLIKLTYNYVYMIILTIALMLNMKQLYQK
tara:strand:- start:35860 stop:36045 length:186 start_codon:yes stop_codon:yes gene_type:complete